MAAPAKTRSWPDHLVGTPSVAVIETAIARDRLAHALLITGDDLDTLEQVGLAIADRLLNGPGAAMRLAITEHPDLAVLRPAGKGRQISVEATRDLIQKLQVSPGIASSKVGIILECDAFNTSASNAFLKTLEEPPPKTLLLLLTTRPYALLPTIRSRCLTFRFPEAPAAYVPPGWDAWLADYRAWLQRLASGVSTKEAGTEVVFIAYGLVARFETVLGFAFDEAWEKRKPELPADLEKDEREALEVGLRRGLRDRLFRSILQATREAARERLQAGDATSAEAYAATARDLHHTTRLFRLYLNELTALEGILLKALRHWNRRRE